MPIYVYRDTVTNQEIEIFQKMKDDPLLVDPETGHPLVKCIIAPKVRTEDNMTIGGLAEKNTRKMVAKGDPRVKVSKDPNPWWRKNQDKPINTTGWTKKQKQRYIQEGKKP